MSTSAVTRLSLLRCSRAPSNGLVLVRTVASQTVVQSKGGANAHVMEKLRNTLEEYRKQNFSRETPTRFKKELVKAAGCIKGDDIYRDDVAIGIESINTVLSNIGVSDQQLLTKDELDELVDGKDRFITAQKMMSLL